MTNYDVIIIGSGPGGYVAAIRAAQLGLKTAIVEREHLGGICLNWGCIPTKALLRSAEILHLTQHASAFGVDTGPSKPNIETMVKRSREVSGKLNAGIDFLLGKNKVDIIWGQAKLVAPGKISVTESTKPAVMPQHPTPRKVLGHGTYVARHIVLATGARPRVLPGLEPDGERIWTYFEAMKPGRIPASLLVVGSGAIGVEFASFYARIGTKVTVVEALPRVLPGEDEEIAALAKKGLEKTGVRFIEGGRVSAAEKHADGLRVTIVMTDGTQVQEKTEHLISAAGVVGNIEELGLEQLGVKTERGCVQVDIQGQSSVPGIWAIGDLAGPPMLAHKASHDAIVCAEAIAGQASHAVAVEIIPRCTYCDPQIASIGLTEAQACQGKREIRVGRFPFSVNGKAIALGEATGMVKVIFDDRTGELLGAHLVGPEVTEMIAAFSVGMSMEATDEALAQTVFAHPTLSESMHEAVLSGMGRAIHSA